MLVRNFMTRYALIFCFRGIDRCDLVISSHIHYSDTEQFSFVDICYFPSLVISLEA
jgi:hypothetical protein